MTQKMQNKNRSVYIGSLENPGTLIHKNERKIDATADLKIRDIMTREVNIISPETTIIECAQKMKEINVGALPVCSGDRVIGLITDRDLAIRAVAKDLNIESTTVESIMSTPVIFSYEDDSLINISKLMEEQQIRRIVVLDQDQRLVGIVSLGDIASKVRNDHLSAEILERVSEPTRGQVA